jgi:hypothetical protein
MMKRKMMKKAMMMVLALAMVCVASVAGTLAYLSHQTGPVTNTFVIGSLFDNATTDFALWEHKLANDGEGDNGVFTLLAGENELVKRNEYKNVLPGVNVPKDPFVRVDGLKEDAYLFLVVEDNTGDHINFTMDSNWELYKTETDGKQIYVYAEAADDYTLSSDPSQRNLGILLDNTVTVDKDFAGGSGINISFTAYIIQSAGLTDRDAAWAAIKTN